MHLLGHHLPDHKLLRVALTSFYGVSHHTSALILARLQIHQNTVVSTLTEPQVTALSAYLSSPATTQRPAPCPIAAPGEGSAAGPSSSASGKGKERAHDQERDVPLMTLREQERLDTLKIETDLRRSMQADIAHHRSIGTYRGRRHAMGLPVRGQNTRNNAKTAKKMNRVDRRHYSSAVRAAPTGTWGDVARIAWSPIAQARRAFSWAAGC